MENYDYFADVQDDVLEWLDPDSTCKCNGWFRVGLF